MIPQDAQLTPWPHDLLKNWDELSADEKKLFERQMEVYAAYLAYVDHEIGRVVQAIEDMGKLDDTLIIYISGDNGGSAEGSPVGTPNEMTFFNGVEVPVADQMPFYDAWGSAETYPHYAVGWAWAMSTPYKWTKQVAGYFGGVRNGMVISWPGHIKDAGGIRNQFHHVIDIVPTILEVTGIEAPDVVDGIDQAPIEGVSLAYTFDKANADAPSTHQTQYFEMFGERALYHDGWIASTRAVPRALERHGPGPEGRGQRRQVGALRPHQRLDPEQRRRGGQSRRSSRNCRICSGSRRRSIRSCRSTPRRSRASSRPGPASSPAATSSPTRARSSASRWERPRAFSTNPSRSRPKSKCPTAAAKACS